MGTLQLDTSLTGHHTLTLHHQQPTMASTISLTLLISCLVATALAWSPYMGMGYGGYGGMMGYGGMGAMGYGGGWGMGGMGMPMYGGYGGMGYGGMMGYGAGMGMGMGMGMMGGRMF